MADGSRFAGIGVGTIVQILQGLGVYRSFVDGVAPRTGRTEFGGPARTLRCIPMREDLVAERRGRDRSEDPHRIVLEDVRPGEVVVIEGRRNALAGVVGDLLAERVRAAGGAAIVTDGCVRDAPGLQGVLLPVFASGFHAATFSTAHLGSAVNVPIALGDVAVLPGDYVVGDVEGVVVVPSGLVEKVVQLAGYQEERDAFLRERIAAGAPLAEAYPPNAALLEEFDQLRRSAPGAEVTRDV